MTDDMLKRIVVLEGIEGRKETCYEGKQKNVKLLLVMHLFIWTFEACNGQKPILINI